jgi:hypothetical protein
MKVKFTWYIPDTLTITDPEKQGPTVALSRDGLNNVITGTNWALKAEALNDDGTPMAIANDPAVYANSTPVVDTISHYTPFDAPDPEKFEDVTKLTREQLCGEEGWLGRRLFQKLNKADQEQQATDRLLKKASPATTFKMPAEPAAGAEGQE